MLSTCSSRLARYCVRWAPQLQVLPSTQHGAISPSITGTSFFSTATTNLQVYQQLHADLVSDLAGVLERLGLRPGRNCQIGDGLATVDLGFTVGDPPQQIAVDVVPSPKEQEQAAAASSAEGGGGNSNGAANRAKSYAAAQVRRQLLASHGWVSVEVLSEDWARIMKAEQQHQQQQPPQGVGPGEPAPAAATTEEDAAGAAARLEKLKVKYLGVLLQQAVEEYDARKRMDHDHDHGEGGCGSGCGHKH